jgi:ribonucleoside-triphosphate reductase
MNVIKRDGTLEEYDSRKVIRALREAFRACNIEYPLTNIIKLAESIRKSEKESMTVEEIQDAVVKFLIDNKCYEVTKAYIIYKEQHKEDREDLERIQYMQKYRDSNTNAAQSSETDANANVAIKNVVNLAGEVYKVKNRRLQRLQMKMKLKELYPDSNLHKQYIKDLEHHIIYTHDESSTPVPENYCEAVSMYPLVDKGVGEMDGVTPKPPKWLNSFCGQFNNLVFLLSAQCKGAVAFGEFFNYFEHYCVIEFGENFVEKADLLASSEYVLHKQTIGDKIDEAFQSIVYYVNQPAGNRSYQSPLIK